MAIPNFIFFFIISQSSYLIAYDLIYHTQNSDSLQYYDCIYYTSNQIMNVEQSNVKLEIKQNILDVKYCRQSFNITPLRRQLFSLNTICYHNGVLVSFSQLQSQNVLPTDVLKFSSSVEQADKYAAYLLNVTDNDDNFLCNCTHPGTFGKFCEYQFYYNTLSFDEAITKQFKSGAQWPESSQYHSNRPCYTTLASCNSGLMCLDWRNICDGQQHCMDGFDEDYCDKLEYNECENDEYRCSNGMCIPGEYWLDSDYDCMDWSDEIGIYVTSISGKYCISHPNFDCDEHLCLTDAYSCGDGQCLSPSLRFPKKLKVHEYCNNLRDINYMCEVGLSYDRNWWTIKDGYCSHILLPYFQSGWNELTAMCDFYVKCALTQGLDKGCNCDSATKCGELVKNKCNKPILVYPSQGRILTPYIIILFLKEHDWQNKAPDFWNFHKDTSLKCSGYQAISNGLFLSHYQPGVYMHFHKFKYIEYFFCLKTTESYRNYSGPQHNKDCWANSTTFTKIPYQTYTNCSHRCISKYRIRDGTIDCPYEYVADENTILSCPPSEQRLYRFHCSSSESSCIMPLAIGNGETTCKNKRDEVTASGLVLRGNVYCWQRNDEGCLFLQDHIRQSSGITTFNDANIHAQNITGRTTTKLPFQYYCDSFLNIGDGLDELNQFCQQWICRIDQYQCLTGQCIPRQWICDGQWDCSDASDEERIFIMNNLTDHNRKIGLDLKEIKDNCSQRYHLNNTAFSRVCNISFEFPCFRRDSMGNDLFDFTISRPCINISQIGDGIIDCIGGADERNLLTCSLTSRMLGYSLLLSNGTCIIPNEKHGCEPGRYYILGSNVELDTVCFHRAQPKSTVALDMNHCGFYLRVQDVVCFNGECIKDARCNGAVECAMGEDEYWCDIDLLFESSIYRLTKSAKLSSSYDLHQYPNPSIAIKPFKIKVSRCRNAIDQITKPETIQRLPKLQNRREETFFDFLRVVLPDMMPIETHYLPFICNRGLAIKNELNQTVCLCPPSSYGELCEYFSDRITVITHLDLKTYKHSTQLDIIKTLAIFLFEDRIIDSYEFHINPLLQTEKNYVKQKIYFLYQRSVEFLQLKQNNRSGTQLYSVRFEAFELYSNKSIIPLAVWHYPIYFDFLPSFRLSKILHLPSQQFVLSNNSCSSEPCVYGRCIPIVNHNSSYFCSCHSGYYGKHCQHYESRCAGHCSPNSICKPKYGGIIASDKKPYCLCSTTQYGPTCALKNDECSKNPCQHHGTCYMSYDPADMLNYTCICASLFYGVNCEISKASVIIRINLTDSAVTAIATTIQYYDIDHRTQADLILRNQQVFDSIPQETVYRHDQLVSPIIGIMKLYGNVYLTNEPTYYLSYVQNNLENINITSNLRSECSHVKSLWHLLQTNTSESSVYNLTTAVFSYHLLCQLLKNVTDTTISFRDNNYLCVCTQDLSRTECFNFDPSSDRCSHCLAGGLCLSDGLKIKNTFKCFCPRCHHGHLCQFLNELMSFTLDSLIVKDIQSSEKISVGIYLSIVVLIFFVGLFNNLCSYLTFIRVKPRKFGVGHYLLIISIVDQSSLLLLMMKVIHIILGSNGTLFYYESLNLYSCKIISYLLSVLTRITYWLTSLVTIERLSMVLFPTSVALKKPKFALGLSTFAMLTVGGMHIHEMLYYMTVADPSYTSVNVTMCVTNYNQTVISTYNRINVLVHYFVPFLIQIISITMLIVQVARSRARTSGSKQETFVDLFKKQLKTQKELYITPMIIVLSSLPQTILSFSYACTELKQSWQRYTLLTTYFLSYLPQILGFVLYVLPSTMFKEEFQQTIIGKRLIKKTKCNINNTFMNE